MSRGSFSFVAQTPAYRNAEKEWAVVLERYHRYWYDLVVNPHEVAEYFDSRQLIVDYLKRVKDEVEAELKKRFVYFICSRERVRFNTRKKPFYNPITGKTTLHLLVGKERKKKKIRVMFFHVRRNLFVRPKIELTEKYITTTDERGDMYSMSVHDCLERAHIKLGLDSRVEYVGYTKNPDTRPTNGAHTGLSDALHRLAEESRDSFICFNTFSVLAASQTNNEPQPFNFLISNAMAGDVSAETEGKILEKCFIFYFDAASQNRNRDNELAELRKNLLKLSKSLKINKICVEYEMDDSSEYGVLSSSSVQPSVRHKFTVQKSQRGVEIIDEERGKVRLLSLDPREGSRT